MIRRSKTEVERHPNFQFSINMKIALIGQKGIPAREGGVEKHVEDLAERLAQEGCQVSVYARRSYTRAKQKRYKHKGAEVINLPSIPTKHLDAISHTFLACLHLFTKKVDVIHFHSIGPSSLILLAKILNPRPPVVAPFHTQCYLHQKWGSFARAYLKLGEISCCKLADRVIAVSEHLKEYVKRVYNREAEYLPNGISANKRSRQPAEIQKWGLEKGNYILSVSRLVRHKGIHYLIEAYKRAGVDKKLVIVGGSASTDEYVKELRQLAGDDPRIIFTGTQSGIILEELFSNAALFVQPSASEGLSVALLEAMAYGLPVLTSDIPENKEVIKDTGYTFRNKHSRNLANKLITVFANPEDRQRKAECGRIRVERNYNWDNIVKRTQQIYKQVIPGQTSVKVKFIKYKRKIEVDS